MRPPDARAHLMDRVLVPGPQPIGFACTREYGAKT